MKKSNIRDRSLGVNFSVNAKDNLIKIVTSLQQESDRGCVLVGAAMIDNLIDDMLRKFLIPAQNKSKEDSLLDLGRACGEAGAKLNLIYRLSLIDNDIYLAIKNVYKLRNKFAHFDGQVSFHADETKNDVLNIIEPIKESVKSIVLMFCKAPEFGMDLTDSPEPISELTRQKGLRVAYVLCIVGLVMSLKHVGVDAVPNIEELWKKSGYPKPLRAG